MPPHHPWDCRPGRGSTWPLLPLPLEGNKPFRGPTVICWRSQGAGRAPAHNREAMPHSLSRCHLGASRKGRAWEYVPPRGWMGSSVPSALTHREAAFHRPGQPRTRGAGSPTAGPSVLGPCLQARQGRNGVPTPTLHRHCGERKTQASLFQKPPQPARRERPSPSPRAEAKAWPPLFPPLFSLWFFSLNAGSL